MAAHAGILGLLWRELKVLDDRGCYVLVTWAAYATVWMFIARRREDRITEVAAHVPFVLVALGMLLNTIAGQGGELAFFNLRAISDLVIIGLAFYVSTLVRDRKIALVYRLAAHVSVLVVLWRELIGLENGGSYVIVAWAAYATVWMLVARRTGDRVGEWAAHVPFGVIALWLALRLVTGQQGAAALFNVKAVADLVVIGLALYVSMLARARWLALVYRLGSHVAFMALLWRDLAAIPNNGNAYVTVAWGIYGMTLVVAGIYANRYAGQSRTLMYVGIGTLFAVVAKLLLLDLVMVDEVWRFLLFLGFGTLFLALSYYLQNLLRPAVSTSDQ
jgi:hypothetical protein